MFDRFVSYINNLQQTEYYPSGTAYAEEMGAGVQPFKFTGKELILMHGLNWQDFGARWLDNVRMQWTTMDPLAEKYYAISPYTYCSDDPVKNIDPDGKGTSDFINEDETDIHIDDGSTAQYKEVGNGVSRHYKFVGFDKSQSGYNTVNLTTAVQEQQKLNVLNPALQPITNGPTFCNYAGQNLFSTIASATNNSENLMSIKGLATDMVMKMEASPLLIKVDQATAHNASEHGSVGFIGEKDYPHGHIASFSTGNNINQGEVANVGRYNGFLNLSPQGNGPSVFSEKSIQKVDFFILSPMITPKTELTIIPFYSSMQINK